MMERFSNAVRSDWFTVNRSKRYEARYPLVASADLRRRIHVTTSIVRQENTRQSLKSGRVLPIDRSTPLRRPQIRKPDWRALDSAPNSNTYGYSNAPTVRPVSRDRMDRIAGRSEYMFDRPKGRMDRFYARVDRVVHSPGATIVSLAATSMLLGLAPLIAP